MCIHYPRSNITGQTVCYTAYYQWHGTRGEHATMCCALAYAHFCNTLQILRASYSLQLDSAIVLKHKGRIKTVIEGTIFQISEWCLLPVNVVEVSVMRWPHCNIDQRFVTFVSPMTVINFRLEKKRWPSTELEMKRKWQNFTAGNHRFRFSGVLQPFLFTKGK